MMPSLALELAPRQLRVNVVSPGAIATPIWTKFGIPADGVAAFKDSIAAGIPFKRMGEPQEAAALVAFLVSDVRSSRSRVRPGWSSAPL